MDDAGDLGHDLEAMSAAERYNRDIVRTFSPYLGRNVVEVGAGIGNISLLLLEHGLARLHAIEPDDGLYASLVDRLECHGRAASYHGFLSTAIERDGIGSAPVDSIVSVNVLEHVEDDVGELATMESILRPGGHLCLWVPAMPALYSRLDRALGHYRRYRRSDLAAKLASVGFRIVHVGYRDLVGMVVWFVSCRLLGLHLTRARVRLYDHLVMPVTSFLGRWMRPPVGKNLVVVARKP